MCTCNEHGLDRKLELSRLGGTQEGGSSPTCSSRRWNNQYNFNMPGSATATGFQEKTLEKLSSTRTIAPDSFALRNRQQHVAPLLDLPCSRSPSPCFSGRHCPSFAGGDDLLRSQKLEFDALMCEEEGGDSPNIVSKGIHPFPKSLQEPKTIEEDHKCEPRPERLEITPVRHSLEEFFVCSKVWR